MTGSSSSTTPPYSSATTSSTPSQPQTSIPQYVVPVTHQPVGSTDSRFNVSDWTIMAVGMLLTGIIGYFSSIMAVKSDIAQNRQDISVITTTVLYVERDLERIESDLKQVNELKENTAVLLHKVNSLEKISKK